MYINRFSKLHQSLSNSILNILQLLVAHTYVTMVCFFTNVTKRHNIVNNANMLHSRLPRLKPKSDYYHNLVIAIVPINFCIYGNSVVKIP